MSRAPKHEVFTHDSPTGRFKLGRIIVPRTEELKLRRFFWNRKRLPGNLPADWDYIDQAIGGGGMMANDQYGDCAMAGYFHMLQVVTAKVTGHAVTVPDEQVIKEYLIMSPNDQGLVMEYVLQKAMKSGLAGHRLCGYAPIDNTNDEQMRAAGLFGCLYLGVILHDNPNPAETNPWDAGGWGNKGGHAVATPKRNHDNSCECMSWNRLYGMTPAFIQRDDDEAWVAYFPEWIDPKTGKTPLGHTHDEMLSFIQALGGHVNPNMPPIPHPEPPKPPIWSPEDPDGIF